MFILIGRKKESEKCDTKKGIAHSVLNGRFKNDREEQQFAVFCVRKILI